MTKAVDWAQRYKAAVMDHTYMAATTMESTALIHLALEDMLKALMEAMQAVAEALKAETEACMYPTMEATYHDCK